MTCRVCQAETDRAGHLFRCKDETCGAAHWNKSAIRKLRKFNKDTAKEKSPDWISTLLVDGHVPEHVSGEHYVYKIRLRGSPVEGAKGRIYVGMTGLHPMARYLNHLRGYKASRIVRDYGTALIGFEGPISNEEARAREPALADELRAQGYEVHGGH